MSHFANFNLDRPSFQSRLAFITIWTGLVSFQSRLVYFTMKTYPKHKTSPKSNSTCQPCPKSEPALMSATCQPRREVSASSKSTQTHPKSTFEVSATCQPPLMSATRQPTLNTSTRSVSHSVSHQSASPKHYLRPALNSSSSKASPQQKLEVPAMHKSN